MVAVFVAVLSGFLVKDDAFEFIVAGHEAVFGNAARVEVAQFALEHGAAAAFHVMLAVHHFPQSALPFQFHARVKLTRIDDISHVSRNLPRICFSAANADSHDV